MNGMTRALTMRSTRTREATNQCQGYMDTRDCQHCDGTGDDFDFTGTGFCGYCAGTGEVEFFNGDGCEHCYEDDDV